MSHMLNMLNLEKVETRVKFLISIDFIKKAHITKLYFIWFSVASLSEKTWNLKNFEKKLEKPGIFNSFNMFCSRISI